MDSVSPRLTAHRGCWGRHLENTLGAVADAIEAGVDYVEIDVRLTADGQVVVLHDPTLERLWNVERAITGLAWEVVSEIRVPAAAGEQRIPLLREVLELFADLETGGPKLLIDMDHAAVAEPAHRVVEESGVSVAWCGFLAGMQTIRGLDSQAEIWLPWNEPGLPPQQLLESLAPAVVNSNHYVLSTGDVASIRALGYRVSVWTLDDPGSIIWARNAGVDCITTNNISLARDILDDHESPRDLLREALEVARDLAKFAISYTSRADLGEVRTKANAADLVTEVDIAIERVVRRVIGERFPDHNFVGEEFGGSAGADRPCWYLDPVDGTTNLANGIPWNSFSLALVIDGAPMVGVVADPWRGEIFEALHGAGAFLNGEELKLGKPANVGGDSLAGSVVSTELAGHLPWQGFYPFLTLLGESACTLRVMGSGTLTVTGVAAGRGAGAVIHSFGPVDHLAGVLISREAGAKVLDEDGNDNLFPAEGGVLVAHPEVADELYRIWRQAVSEK